METGRDAGDGDAGREGRTGQRGQKWMGDMGRGQACRQRGWGQGTHMVNGNVENRGEGTAGQRMVVWGWRVGNRDMAQRRLPGMGPVVGDWRQVIGDWGQGASAQEQGLEIGESR